MMTLRWILGIIATLIAVGLTALAIVGGGFRRSFGASDNAPWLTFGPALVALLLIASVVWPDRRMLLHGVAVLMIALGVGCLFLARETIFVASVGLLYVAAWLAFYWRAAWGRQ